MFRAAASTTQVIRNQNLIRCFASQTGISPEHLYKSLGAHGTTFYTGVPDSLLKDFCAYVTDNLPPENHIIAANEGNAMALASGYHLSTGSVPLVYMQNSGLGNCVNPLTSLTDPEVYSIPMLMLIGWRGEPGVKDEPQHVKQGRVTLDLLKCLEVPYDVLPDNEADLDAVLTRAYTHITQTQSPYALVVRKGQFTKYTMQGDSESVTHSQCEMNRERAMEEIVKRMPENAAVVSTTGKGSRELFELRARTHSGHHRDFLTVGAMGHTGSIALGMALGKRDTPVYCMDGDGSVLMHMGSLAIAGTQPCTNLKHILINNAAHESVGGQPSVGDRVDFRSVATACGYKSTFFADTAESVAVEMEKLAACEGPALLEVRVTKKGARSDLGRPTTTPVENKEALMRFLRGE